MRHAWSNWVRRDVDQWAGSDRPGAEGCSVRSRPAWACPSRLSQSEPRGSLVTAFSGGCRGAQHCRARRMQPKNTKGPARLLVPASSYPTRCFIVRQHHGSSKRGHECSHCLSSRPPERSLFSTPSGPLTTSSQAPVQQKKRAAIITTMKSMRSMRSTTTITMRSQTSRRYCSA